MTATKQRPKPAPPGLPLAEVPDAPKNSTVRCHWATDVNPETGETALIFIPGCATMLHDPEHEQCGCDTLAHRLLIQVEQRRDCDEEITALRERLRAWSRAGAAAYTALTGRETRGGYIHAEDLARAAATAPTSGGSP